MIGGFNRRSGPPNGTAEWFSRGSGNIGDFVRRFRNRRLEPPFGPEKIFSIRSRSAVSNGGQAAERNRRFTKNGEIKGEAKGISTGDHRAKQSTPMCRADISKHPSGNELLHTKS